MSVQIVLYHYWRSSCSWRVRWALALKQLEYTSIAINLLEGEHRTPEFLKRNPSGFVPCLEVNGKAFGESLAILEWLEEEYPQPPLLPQDSLSRLKVRQLALTMVAGTQPLQNLCAQRYYSDDAQRRSEYAQYWINQGLQKYEVLATEVAGKFSFGDSITFADLCLIPQCYNAVRFGVELDKYPIIDKIYHSCLQTPECKASAPDNQPGAK